MKAAPFEYSRAADIDEACAMADGRRRRARDCRRADAGADDGDAARPPHPADRHQPHRRIVIYPQEQDGDGVAIGATTRQCVVERDRAGRGQVPLLARAIPNIGHAATRARGTIGGSLANADPAAELPLVAVTLDAMLHYRAGGETAEIPARRILHRPDDHRAAGRRDAWSACVSRFGKAEKIGVGFHEVNARRSDFAFVSAAAQVELGADGKCKRIAIGVGAATDFPMRLESAEQQLKGSSARCQGGGRGDARGACRYRCAGRSARLGRIPPPRRGRISPAAPSPMRWPTRKRAKRRDVLCALSSTSTARCTQSRSSRAPRCSIACATCSVSRARMPAASTASAAPAPCCSTAWPCAPA